MIPAVDTHAHVFDRTCRLVEPRRYSPDYEAPTDAYLAELDRAGVSYGVLVQPSFLGTDNTYLLAALNQHPNRLRGIVVVAPEVTDAQLDTMAASGVRGIRYNLFGLDPGLIARPEMRALTARAASRGWLVEVHAPGPALPSALDTLVHDADRIVIHHFGRPEATRTTDDPGFRRLMEFSSGDPVFIKLSAAYRLSGIDPAPYAAAFLDRFGPQRLLWGSDWPWTQHEDETNYQGCLDEFATRLAGDLESLKAIDRASRALYGFAIGS